MRIRIHPKQIASAIGDGRDKLTLNGIEKLLNNYPRVAVIYGSVHFLNLRKCFDNAFGDTK